MFQRYPEQAGERRAMAWVAAMILGLAVLFAFIPAWPLVLIFASAALALGVPPLVLGQAGFARGMRVYGWLWLFRP
ncbi:hypothetical protein [Pseudomonas sp. NPDC007930]|uniref:hypothetical protein n=1 Tax=Pseudomonas sp. NPDC007930 TaxID=3364417 RepID=UPI0036EAC30E